MNKRSSFDIQAPDQSILTTAGETAPGDGLAEQMSPLYLFLASSLNVELVFIILTSISLFSRVTRDEHGHAALECSDDIAAVLIENGEG